MDISYTIIIVFYILGCATMHHVFNKAEQEIIDKNEIDLETIPKWVWFSLKFILIVLSWLGLVTMLLIALIKLRKK